MFHISLNIVFLSSVQRESTTGSEVEFINFSSRQSIYKNVVENNFCMLRDAIWLSFPLSPRLEWRKRKKLNQNPSRFAVNQKLINLGLKASLARSGSKICYERFPLTKPSQFLIWVRATGTEKSCNSLASWNLVIKNNFIGFYNVSFIFVIQRNSKQGRETTRKIHFKTWRNEGKLLFSETFPTYVNELE